MKDSKGFVWVGTHNGLNKFNGCTFSTYQYDDQNEFSISSDKVLCVLEDQKGRIWVGTDNGLNRFDQSTGHFFYLKADSLKNNYLSYVCALTMDNSGKIWVGSNNGFYSFDPDNEVFVKPSFSTDIDQRIDNMLVRCLEVDKNNQLWAGTNGYGIFKYNLQTSDFDWYLYHFGDEFSTHLNYTFALHEDPDGEIWIGTYVGGLGKTEAGFEQPSSE